MYLQFVNTGNKAYPVHFYQNTYQKIQKKIFSSNFNTGFVFK